MKKEEAVCQICNGTGFIKEPETGDIVRCQCKLREDLLAALTTRYKDGKYIPNLDYESLSKKNIYVENKNPLFKGLVKSIVIDSGMEVRFKTFTGQDILQQYITSEPDQTIQAQSISYLGILVLELGFDPSNKSYSETIPFIIENRVQLGFPVWVNLRVNLESQKFKDIYGQSVIDIIKKHCTKLEVNK